ncbi:MAG: hypothetical protein V2A69_16060 [Pseudomonadota bacterium]
MGFRDLIEGKKVVFVGPSTNLQGRGKGKIIEKFDVVVRTNGAFPVAPKLVADYGKRCDVLYLNTSFVKIMAPLPFDVYKKAGLKCVVFKGIDKSILLQYNEIILARIIPDTCRVWTGPGVILMGLMILRDLMSCGAKKIHIIGIDFYSSGKHYFDGYVPPVIKKIAAARTKVELSSVHDTIANAEEMISLIRAHKRLFSVDEEVQKIIDIKNSHGVEKVQNA